MDQKYNVHLEMRNLELKELQRLKKKERMAEDKTNNIEQKGEQKKLQEEKKSLSETEDHEKQLLATLKRLK